MQGIGPSLEQILAYLLENRGIDFSGYHPAMLERRVKQRLRVAGCGDMAGYCIYLLNTPGEIDNLLDAITINVSRFFRDTLTFELIADQILPTLAREKMNRNEASLRIWSAGCARGEEPYSMAILIRELRDKEGWPENVHFFATDIDPKVLDAADKAQYTLESLKNVKFKLLSKYFSRHGDLFTLNPEIREMVTFSRYDLLDKVRGVPPESVFGDFDLVLCRNVLIYFNLHYQAGIFERLYHALSPRGFLVLGMVEKPPECFRNHFQRVFAFSQIYGRR
ncbi:CheR family methyltransferase [Desulfonatronum thiodismutans]|uniref:CheR family methyltransferase n=1 Tax=Desulfonatronum thiodismutans TaxID=159290 RepID=UPI000691733B|nr:protein-glutamate O-methyltransferase CheR [Desulfonatronum thiodismutans]